MGAEGEKQVTSEVKRRAAAETHLWCTFPVSLALWMEPNWYWVHCFVYYEFIQKSKVRERQ